MSQQWTKKFGDECQLGLQSLGIGRGVFSLCLILGLLVSASSAMAAEIVEVRIGRHAEFTRVVFELDRAAGYRIERADPTSDVTELVVSLDASSIPRRIQSTKSLIEQVEVEPSGGRSIIRVRLAKDGLRLKEMILANPPRIVLDVLADPASLAKAKATAKPSAAPAPKPAPRVAEKKAAAPAREEESFDEVIAQIPTAPKVVAKVEPKPAPKAVAEPAPKKVVAPTPAPAPMKVAAKVVEKPKPVVADEPSTLIPIEEPKVELVEAVVVEEIVVPEPMPVMEEPKPAASERRPMMVVSKPKTDDGLDYTFWALVGGGAVAVLIGGVFLARRMRSGGEVDFSDGDGSGEGSAFDDAPASRVAADENPFGNLGEDDEQMTLGSAGGAKSASLVDEEKESESVVFGDSEEKKMDDMEVISRDQVNQSLGNDMPPMGGVPEEFQQMMREMNRRVESLEGRIDELVDARDRLERQVAAQTEELRVQRAAIARTQRAVRNLARPGEEEQEATEPALRDPNQPTS